MRRFAFFFSMAILLAPLGAPIVHAQNFSAGDELTVSISPQFPRPYDTVTATVSSTQLDLSAGTIVISVNGKVVGENARSASFQVGGAGVKTVISVKVTDAAGTHAGSLTIYPEEVSLMLEPSSTVPPFYKGARMVASEAPVRLVALPNFKTAAGTAIPAGSLVYSWKFGDRVLEAQSGIGRSVLSATAPVRYRDARITVTVSTQDKSLVAQAGTLVTPVDPVMRIYRNDPLSGIDFGTALTGTLGLTESEETFHAVPFFFASMPRINWSLNGTDNDTDPDLTVRTTGSTAGTALISARAEGGALSGAEARFTVQFGKTRSTGIFGL